MAADRRNAEDTDAGFDGEDDLGAGSDGVDDLGSADVLDDDAEGATTRRDPDTESLWAGLRVDPVEIALPTGSGYTLRAYRSANELTPSAIGRDADPADQSAATPARAGTGEHDDTVDSDGTVDSDDALVDDGGLAEDEPIGEEPTGEEEVPVFLGHGGRLYLFRTPESLVQFVRSADEHDLTQLDTWPELVERVRPQDVVAADEDDYELDLVVDNLRGGHDVWDPELIVSAGEIARDLAYALRAESILAALAPGSPLDDLDDALRAALAGGLGGFRGRRRLRKIGAQQATLGWRTIIGKISGLVDWRD